MRCSDGWDPVSRICETVRFVPSVSKLPPPPTIPVRRYIVVWPKVTALMIVVGRLVRGVQKATWPHG